MFDCCVRVLLVVAVGAAVGAGVRKGKLWERGARVDR
jgi:hypothetical protein